MLGGAALLVQAEGGHCYVGQVRRVGLLWAGKGLARCDVERDALRDRNRCEYEVETLVPGLSVSGAHGCAEDHGHR